MHGLFSGVGLLIPDMYLVFSECILATSHSSSLPGSTRHIPCIFGRRYWWYLRLGFFFPIRARTGTEYVTYSVTGYHQCLSSIQCKCTVLWRPLRHYLVDAEITQRFLALSKKVFLMSKPTSRFNVRRINAGSLFPRRHATNNQC